MIQKVIENRFLQKIFLSIILSGCTVLISLRPHLLIDKGLIEGQENASPEDILNTTRFISGIVIKPVDFLAAAGALATLYIATTLANRIQLNKKDEKTRSFIENRVSNLSSVLCIYSLICMNFYFFQEDRGQLSFGEFIFYLASAYIFYLISAYPPIDTSKLSERKAKNQENIRNLEGQLEEVSDNKTNSQEVASLAGAKEFHRIRAYLRYAKSRWASHLFLLFTSIPLVTSSLFIILIATLFNKYNPIETIRNLSAENIIIVIFIFSLQIFYLGDLYEKATRETREDILEKREQKAYYRPTTLFGAILFTINIFIHLAFTEMVIRGDNPNIFIITALIIPPILIVANHRTASYIYKKYRKYLQTGDMGKDFRRAVLEQALQDAREEHDSLEKKIKETQEPALSPPRLPSE